MQSQVTLSRAALSIEPTAIRYLRDRARDDSLDLGLGQPDLPVSETIVQRVYEHLAKPYAPYTANLGDSSLRHAVGRHYSCSAENIMITCGVQQGLSVAILGLVNEGDEVLVPNPGFPAYANLVRAAGGIPAEYSFRQSKDVDGFIEWNYDIDAIIGAISPKTRLMIFNSPSNPTGAVIGENELRTILDYLVARNIAWISDEIYEDFVYDTAHYSPWDYEEYRPYGIKLSGASKKYHLMGWRIGWLIANKELIELLKPLHQHLVTCAPDFAQVAASAAIENHALNVTQTLDVFRRRREIAIDTCMAMDDIVLSRADGAFYVFLDIRRFLSGEVWRSSMDVALAILAHTNVITIPGSGFGSAGEGFLRIAYTIEENTLLEALHRIQGFFADNRSKIL